MGRWRSFEQQFERCPALLLSPPSISDNALGVAFLKPQFRSAAVLVPHRPSLPGIDRDPPPISSQQPLLAHHGRFRSIVASQVGLLVVLNCGFAPFRVTSNTGFGLSPRPFRPQPPAKCTWTLGSRGLASGGRLLEGHMEPSAALMPWMG